MATIIINNTRPFCKLCVQIQAKFSAKTAIERTFCLNQYHKAFIRQLRTLNDKKENSLSKWYRWNAGNHENLKLKFFSSDTDSSQLPEGKRLEIIGIGLQAKILWNRLFRT